MIELLNNKRRKEEGFSLVELLVVILIIGVIIAIAVPLYLNHRKAAMIASVTQDVKNTALEAQTWLANNPNVIIDQPLIIENQSKVTTYGVNSNIELAKQINIVRSPGSEEFRIFLSIRRANWQTLNAPLTGPYIIYVTTDSSGAVRGSMSYECGNKIWKDSGCSWYRVGDFVRG